MIIIIDYGMGNLGSILNMFNYLDISAAIHSDPRVIAKAGKIILPGVGAFDNGMLNLKESGIYDVLMERVTVDKIPVLGICLGMQLMTESSEEGMEPGLGWIKATTRRFNFENISNLKVPHVGWNNIRIVKPNPVVEGLDAVSKFYFVHSYYVECRNLEDVVCKTTYGHAFDTVIAHENIYGCQFHPEKSHKYGMKVYENFNKL